jgi:GPH family glycoside/pentoside/hexuronide:cation symporter
MNLNGYGKLIKKDRVSGFEKFAFGMGEISTNIVFTIATSLLTMFYTDVAHVSAAVIGMIIAVSQIFNGISDISAPVPSTDAPASGCCACPFRMRSQPCC